MLRLAIVGAIALLPFSAVAAAASSPTLYPSFTTTPAKKGPAAPLYPSFNSPKVSASPTITTFNIAGATEIAPRAINDTGTIAGYYTTGSNNNATFHGFVRAANGTIKMFDVPGAGKGHGNGTSVLGINASGEIVGFYINTTTHMSAGFVRAQDGKITEFTPPGSGAYGTEALGINDAGTVVGQYNGGCYLRHNTGVMKDFYCGPIGDVTGINADGTVTGVYGGDHIQAFVRTSDGTRTRFRMGPQSTVPSGINSAGVITGYSSFNGDVEQWGFVRAPDGALTKFRAPHAILTQTAGINDAGVVAGYLQTSGGAQPYGFVRAADGTITTFQPPGATVVYTTGINNNDVVIGWYEDSGGTHAYIFTP